MPVGPWPVNDGPCSPVNLAEARWLAAPARDSIPRSRTRPKDGPWIWPQCGAAGLNIPVPGGPGSPVAAGGIVAGVRQNCWPFPVDSPQGRSLYARSRRAVRLRRDCAPLKLLTGIVNGIRLYSDARASTAPRFTGEWDRPGSRAV